jgi:hypothetical protein
MVIAFSLSPGSEQVRERCHIWAGLFHLLAPTDIPIAVLTTSSLWKCCVHSCCPRPTWRVVLALSTELTHGSPLHTDELSQECNGPSSGTKEQKLSKFSNPATTKKQTPSITKSQAKSTEALKTPMCVCVRARVCVHVCVRVCSWLCVCVCVCVWFPWRPSPHLLWVLSL